jgi:uncharacterized membrane protein (Fun14 family)
VPNYKRVNPKTRQESLDRVVRTYLSDDGLSVLLVLGTGEVHRQLLRDYGVITLNGENATATLINDQNGGTSALNTTYVRDITGGTA